MSTLLFLIALLIMTFFKLLIQGFFLIHRLQQLGYYNLKLIKWIEGKQYREILLWNIFELLFPLLIIYILFVLLKKIPNKNYITIYKYITSSIMSITFVWKLVHPFISGWVGPRAKPKEKVPLKYTARVKRLIFTLIFVIILILIFDFILTAMPFESFTLSTLRFFQFNAFLLFISVITPVVVLIANIINTPFENLIHIGYFNKAKKKVNKTKIKKIAITGSYGKTSTKFFLKTVISEKYKTLFTPASYNTPMGISKVINNEKFFNDYEYFVIEMGADKKGDINHLCKLAKPNFAIVTAIDIQHLESFGNLKNIIETKLSMFKNVSDDGFGIYNYDSKILQESISNRKYNIPLYSYSINEKDFTNVNIIAKDIKHTRDGLSFTAVLEDGENIKIETDILGRHNVSNLLASILCAKLIGLSNEEIKNGVKKIEPVEHRLQKISSPTGVLVLDDAFNANLNGAYEAVRVLNEIDGNKKIIVTPGFIELGEKEDESNKIFGNNIGENVDIAILVGKDKTEKIYEGIIEKGFDKKNIYIVSSLNDAKKILAKVLKSGDVVLFENDLPDTFNEK